MEPPSGKAVTNDTCDSYIYKQGEINQKQLLFHCTLLPVQVQEQQVTFVTVTFTFYLLN